MLYLLCLYSSLKFILVARSLQYVPANNFKETSVIIKIALLFMELLLAHLFVTWELNVINVI